MTSSIDEAISAAQQGAANLVVQESTNNTSVSTHTVSAQSLDLDSVIDQFTPVDHWLKSKEAGFLVGLDTDNYVKTIPDVEITLSNVFLYYGLRYGSNPVNYHKSADRVTDLNSGESWPQLIERAKQLDSKVRGDYPCADITMTCTKDLVVDGTTLAKAGDVLGYTTSVTGFSEFVKFAKAVKGQDPSLESQPVVVDIKCEKRHKAGVNPWGVLTFGETFKVA